ncbi:MAG: hypothetical protein K0R38_5256 [Polyangiaceae bacterium]|nr:hypothetical protein [Polyangiaceae bacterium]
MKSFSFAKILTLGCFALLLPVACGDDDEGDGGPVGGSGGSAAGQSPGVGGAEAGSDAGGMPSVEIPGTSDSSTTTQCGGDECTSTETVLPTLFIDPCCTAATTCGVDSGFLTLLGTDLKGACLPQNQPGELDSACPDSPANSVPFNGQSVGVKAFKGCCRAATNTCGFLVNDIVTDIFGPFTSPELGCVDSAAFTGEAGEACGEGAGGAGGGSSGGAPGTGGGGAPTEGGAPVVGGAGGAGGTP